MMMLYFTCFFTILLVTVTNSFKIEHIPTEKLNVSEIIKFYGYPCEDYSVTTEDGYILGVQRIPHGKGQTYSKSRPAVYLQHGLLDASPTWIVNPPNEGLGYLLADAGYDVWLGNSRGNTYSKRNIHFSPAVKEFWQFTFDQMAAYDVPAIIDTVLEKTGHEQLYYVGHSEGTLIAFIEFSQNQTYAKKVKKFGALAPVATVGDIKGLLYYFAKYTGLLNTALNDYGIYEFMPNTFINKDFAEYICGSFMEPLICNNVLYAICGPPGGANFNGSQTPVYFSHAPAGTSLQNIIHWEQIVKSNRTQKFDYGTAGNLAHYGQKTAPYYNVSQLSVPTALFSGSTDFLADPTDVAVLKQHIKHVLKFDKEYKDYNHLDFVWGDKCFETVYKDLINFLSS